MTNNSNRTPPEQALAGFENPSRYKHQVSSRLESVDSETGEITVSNISDTVRESRRSRFKLLEASSKVLLGFYGAEPPLKANGHTKRHRTCSCYRTRISPTAQVLKSEQSKKAFFAGVMQCASVWTCPLCAAKINERKASEMRVAFNQASELGLKAHLVTFTAPHTAGDHIDALSSKMREALASFWRERQIANWKKERAVKGNIRAFEVRYGANGWHPHFHLIVFSKDSILGDTERLLEKWQAVCVRAGLDKPNEYGLDIQDGSKAGEYICKFGSDGEVLEKADGQKVSWDAADEMTKGNSKTGRTGSLSPWDMLRIISETTDDEERKKYSGLFLFYARAMKGASQLKWSRGLRKVFELEAEKTDEELLAEYEDKAKLLCHLSALEWSHLIKNKTRSVILDLAETGGSEAVARYLYNVIHKHKVGAVNGDWFAIFYSEFMARQSEPPS